jgi:hypothetical protein
MEPKNSNARSEAEIKILYYMKRKVTVIALGALIALSPVFAKTETEIRLPEKVQETFDGLRKKSLKQSAKDLQSQNDFARQQGMHYTTAVHQKLNGNQTVVPRTTHRAGIIYNQPEGTLKTYTRSGSAYFSTMFGLGGGNFTDAVADVVFTKEGKVYFKNLVSQAGLNTWVEGTVQGSTIKITFPQQVGTTDYGYGFLAVKLTIKNNWYVPASDQVVTLNYDAATGEISSSGDLNTGAEAIGLIYDDDYSWTNYADYNITFSAVKDALASAPAGLQTSVYSLQSKTYEGSIVQVGFDGNDVYVQGLDPNLPENWVKGTIQGNKVVFKNGQYVGADHKAGYHQYLLSAVGEEVYDEEYDETYTSYSLTDNDIVFNYDASTKSLTNSSTFLINSGKTVVNYLSVFEEAAIVPFAEVAATPAAPVINAISEEGWEYYKQDYGWGYLDFDVKTQDVNGNYILPEKLSYAVWTRVNGEEKQLVTSWLDYAKQPTATMTEFPYGYTDSWDVYNTGVNNNFFYHVIGPEAFGVQAIYRGAGEERRSEIAWAEVSTIGAEVQPAAATPAYPVASIQEGDKTVTFGYYTNSGENIGTVTNYSKPETYDVAIKIDDAALVGNYIKSITFPLQETKSVSNLQVFLTSQLRVENGKNAADIVVKSVTPAEAGFITVELDNPYLIPEGGVYAGYSMTIDKVDSEANEKPIGICDKPAQGGFYLHTSDGFLKWLDVSEGMGGSSLLTVDVIGSTIKGDAVVVAAGQTLYAKVGEPFTLPITLVNYGGNGAKSVVVAYEVAGLADSQQFEVSLSNVAGASKEVLLNIPAIANAGEYDFKVKVAQVNGKDNEETGVTVLPVAVLNTYPKKRALLEEYTGLWCGWCPRGYVALEKLAELYPDDYVLVSYHNGDDMEITTDYPSNVRSFPSAWMDRGVSLDAYYGTTEKEFGIADDLAKRNKDFGFADLALEAVLSDNGVINISTDVTFPFNLLEGNYSVEYVLTANGLKNASWAQSNYYAEESQGNPLYMDQFSKGPSSVTGLVFNDVVVLTSELLGGSQNDIELAFADVSVNFSYSFNLSDAVNSSNQPVIQDKNQLKVAALLIDRNTGAVVNANQTKVVNPSAISAVENTPDRSVTVFDLQGRRVNQTVKGLYIVNGRKVVIK